jgi:hypothetical protein
MRSPPPHDNDTALCRATSGYRIPFLAEQVSPGWFAQRAQLVAVVGKPGLGDLNTVILGSNCIIDDSIPKP